MCNIIFKSDLLTTTLFSSFCKKKIHHFKIRVSTSLLIMKLNDTIITDTSVFWPVNRSLKASFLIWLFTTFDGKMFNFKESW